MDITEDYLITGSADHRIKVGGIYYGKSDSAVDLGSDYVSSGPEIA